MKDDFWMFVLASAVVAIFFGFVCFMIFIMVIMG